MILPEFQNTYGAGADGTFSWGDKLSKACKNYAESFFRTGFTTNNTVSLSGGSENFKGYNDNLTRISEYGMRGLCHLADKVDYCMAVSAYNAQVLRELNYQCPIVIRPILIPFSDYAKAPDPEVMARYENDGYTNFVFVGRIAPNKKQEDVIRAFYCYKKYCNPKSRLFLVGSYQGMERYYHRLRR